MMVGVRQKIFLVVAILIMMVSMMNAQTVKATTVVPTTVASTTAASTTTSKCSLHVLKDPVFTPRFNNGTSLSNLFT